MVAKKRVEQRKNSHPYGPLPEGVEVVTIHLPVYVGPVPTDRPYQLDQVQLKLLSHDQRIGVNRIFGAIERLAIRDESIEPAAGREFQPFMRNRSEASRWVFAQIAAAVAQQFGDD